MFFLGGCATHLGHPKEDVVVQAAIRPSGERVDLAWIRVVLGVVPELVWCDGVVLWCCGVVWYCAIVCGREGVGIRSERDGRWCNWRRGARA